MKVKDIWADSCQLKGREGGRANRYSTYQIQSKRNEDDLEHPLAGGRID